MRNIFESQRGEPVFTPVPPIVHKSLKTGPQSQVGEIAMPIKDIHVFSNEGQFWGKGPLSAYLELTVIEVIVIRKEMEFGRQEPIRTNTKFAFHEANTAHNELAKRLL